MTSEPEIRVFVPFIVSVLLGLASVVFLFPNGFHLGVATMAVGWLVSMVLVLGEKRGASN